MQTRNALTAERWHGEAVTEELLSSQNNSDLPLWGDMRGLKARANAPNLSLPSQSRTRRASSPMGRASEL